MEALDGEEDDVRQVTLAYGREGLTVDLPDEAAVITPVQHPAAPDVPAELRRALREPVSGPPLRERVRRGQTVAISACDGTRAQPRVLMIPAVLVLLSRGAPRDCYWAAWVFSLAGVTDMLDGWLARRLGVASRWGALIDPIADRVFVLAAVGTFVANGALSPLQAVALLLRDVMTVIGFFVAKAISWLRAVTFRARPLGKVVTVLQLATLLALIVVPRVVPALIVAVAAVAVTATGAYTLLLWRERARDTAADERRAPQ